MKKLLNHLLYSGILDVAGANDQGDIWTLDGTRIQSRTDVVEAMQTYSETQDIQEATIEERVSALEMITQLQMEEF